MDYWHAKNRVQAPARERANGSESPSAIPELNFAASLAGLGTIFSSHKATKFKICIVHRTYFTPRCENKTSSLRPFEVSWGESKALASELAVPQQRGANQRPGHTRRTSLSTRSIDQWHIMHAASQFELTTLPFRVLTRGRMVSATFARSFSTFCRHGPWRRCGRHALTC